MGNRGNGEWWNHRNNQRIGCAVTSDPEGEWRRKEEPVIDVSSRGFDSLMTSNPTVTQMPDGRVLAVYKGVSKEGELPKGGPVICGVAIAEHPEAVSYTHLKSKCCMLCCRADYSRIWCVCFCKAEPPVLSFLKK